MTPYTYLIGWTEHNLWYYGCRYRNQLPPEDDLWNRYFTSSKTVKRLRKEIGEPDHIEVRHRFQSKEACVEWEDKVIKRLGAVKSTKWLNRGRGGKEFYSRERSQETKDKIRKSLTGRKRPEFSDEWKANLSLGKVGKKYPGKGLGKKHSEDGIDNCRKAARKRWETRERVQHPNTRAAITKRLTCPWCGKEGAVMGMKRWHFDNCKVKK